jgi:GNAT superfamily N-acetyltransferase
MSDIQIREATDDDLVEILGVLRASLGETPVLKRTPELWSWKHHDNPFGPSIVLVATLTDRIAGVRAMMRWQLETATGKILECVRPVDTATHPDFARLGVFRELTMSAIETARSSGIDLIFNTPNDRSAPGYLKMGWKSVGSIGVLVRPILGAAARLDPETVPSMRDLGPTIAQVPSSLGSLPVREPLGLRTPRTDAYLRWRFMSHPTAQYGWVGETEVGGAVVRASSRGGRAEMVVSDILGGPSSEYVKQAAKQARTRYLAGWFSPGTPERMAANRGGMFSIPGFKALRLVARPLTELTVDVLDLGSWDLATSDLELL